MPREPRRTFSALLGAWFIQCSVVSAQIPFDWVVRAGGSQNDRGYGLCTDASGHIYATGVAETGAVFGTQNPGIDDIDGFIAKYDATGTALWARKFGGSGLQDAGADVRTDAEGNVYVLGVITGTAQAGGITLVSHGQLDLMLAKYDSAGSVLWAVNAGGAFDEVAGSLALDPEGNVLITGSVGGQAVFGTDTLPDPDGTGSDVLLAKYDADGNFIWAERFGGVYADMGQGLAVDAVGNILLAGFFTDYIYFDGTLHTNSGRCPFLAKCDPTGAVLWSVSADGTVGEVHGLALTPEGDAVFTGMYIWGQIGFSGQWLTAPSVDGDVFLARYGSDGSLQWARTAGGAGREFPGRLAIDPQGHIIVGGWYNAATTFGAYSLPLSGETDAFVSVWSPAGEVLSLTKAGGAEQFPLGYEESATAAAVDDAGTVYLTGTFKGTSTFAPHSITSVGNADLFLARLPAMMASVSEGIVEEDRSIWPDPASDQLHVRSPAGITDPAAEWVLYDATGRAVQRERIVCAPGEIRTLDVRARPGGTYLLRIEGSRYAWSAPIIIVR